jgi:phage terminase large subunit
MAAAQRVVIPYSPRRHFMGYHESSKRWRVIVAHRRAGKTVATINQLIRSALTCDKPEPRCAYVAPLYKQAKDVAWTYLKRFTQVIPGASANESELRVDLPNGSRVRLYGADNPDGMRGIYLDDCVLDEFADMRPRMLPEIIRPALSDRRGSLTIIGTPRGHNDFHDIYQQAIADEDWFTLLLRASETGIVPAEELESARKLMAKHPGSFEQEYECNWEAAIQGAYWGKEMAAAEAEGRICEVPIDIEQPVHTAWDLGVRDATAIWFFQVLAGGLNIVDFYEASGVGLDHYNDILRERARVGGYQLGPCHVPHDAKVKEWGSGRTRIEQMESLGLTPDLVQDHRLMDGIGAARESLARTRFDRERCKDGIEALKQYRADYDEERKVLKPTPRHDWTSHAADAFRYLAMGWRDFTEPKEDDAHVPTGSWMAA